MTTEHEEILALAGECSFPGQLASAWADEFETFYNAARKPLEEMHASMNNRVFELRDQLIVTQAREQQLREALHYSLAAWHYDGVSDEHGSIFQEANDRCDAPQDTAALPAMIAKAGEVKLENKMDKQFDGDWKSECLNLRDEIAALKADREQLVAKAGECMRERCIEIVATDSERAPVCRITELPALAMKDLK